MSKQACSHELQYFDRVFIENHKIFQCEALKKKFAHFLKRFANFGANFFCSKSAEMKILLCNVGIRNKLYEIFLFDLCVKNWSL